MNNFPPVDVHIGIVDCVMQRNGVTPDDDDGDEDDSDGNTAMLAVREA